MDAMKSRVRSRGLTLLELGGLALLVGWFVGLIGAAFRLALLEADQLRDRLVTWAQGASFLGLVTGCAAATAIGGSGSAGWRKASSGHFPASHGRPPSSGFWERPGGESS